MPDDIHPRIIDFHASNRSTKWLAGKSLANAKRTLLPAALLLPAAGLLPFGGAEGRIYSNHFEVNDQLTRGAIIRDRDVMPVAISKRCGWICNASSRLFCAWTEIMRDTAKSMKREGILNSGLVTVADQAAHGIAIRFGHGNVCTHFPTAARLPAALLPTARLLWHTQSVAVSFNTFSSCSLDPNSKREW